MKMSRLLWIVLLFSVILSSCRLFEPPRAESVKNPTSFSKQIVVVKARDWNSLTGTLQCYEREYLGSPWRAVGEETPVDFGRTGLAWGRGLQGGSLGSGPRKREGDGKSPAGAFQLSAVFGYAPADSMQFLKMRYLVNTAACQCIDDPRSTYYNLVVDSLSVTDADWSSHENMRQPDNSYKWGVLVDHNAAPRHTNAGSCIFLHVWSGSSVPTSGCTAMEESRMYSLIQWLDEGRNPVLVQLPESEYHLLRNAWNLP